MHAPKWFARLPDLLPEPVVRRTAWWVSRVLILVAPVYLAGWWLAGWRSYAIAHFSLAFVFWLSIAWAPLMILLLWLQATLLALDTRRLNAVTDKYEATMQQALAQLHHGRIEIVRLVPADPEDGPAPPPTGKAH